MLKKYNITIKKLFVKITIIIFAIFIISAIIITVAVRIIRYSSGQRESVSLAISDNLFFSQNNTFSNQENIYEKFIATLNNLGSKLESFKLLSLKNSELMKEQVFDTRYIIVEKESSCSFPTASLILGGGGIYKESKEFGGIKIGTNKMFYFIANKANPGSFINQIYFYATGSSLNGCQDYTVSFFNYDFNQDLEKYKKDLPDYSLNIDKGNYQKLLSSIPTLAERSQSSFQFPYVDAIFNRAGEEHDIKLKNRGETYFNWLNEKKSYTVKFKNWYDSNEKLLFYIPEKRSYSGEYLTNNLAKILGLDSLESSFGRLAINGQNFGVYYVTEDFDKYFLAKRVLPEANIYNADPYKIPRYTFDVSGLNKEMILPTIKAYQQNSEQDINYFLSVIKTDEAKLKQEWVQHFNPENLSKILALSLLTGTFHYYFKNMVFYINPTDGRIYFFPWDFMNYSTVGDLNTESLRNFNNDYFNVNEIFSKLLEIPEVRDERNRIIYEYSDQLASYLKDFYTRENVTLFANFITDKTTEFYVGEYNRPSMVTLLEIPNIIDNNLELLKKKISKINVSGFITNKDGLSKTINLQADNFSSLSIKKIVISNLKENKVSEIAVGDVALEKSDYSINNAAGDLEITIFKKITLSPILSYEKKHATPVYLEPSFLKINFALASPVTLAKITVTVENVSTGETQDFIINSQALFAPASSGSNAILPPVEFVNDLVVISEQTGAYHFVTDEILIKEDLIIPSGVKLIIDPGTKIKLAKGKSIISYGEISAVGTVDQPIIFARLDSSQPWGVVGLMHEAAKGNFTYCVFEGGKDANIDGKYFSGMLSGYYTSVNVQNCRFQYAGADDSINFKEGIFTVEGSSFYKNSFDAIDFDVAKSGSTIKGNYFYGNGNDGIDVSGSNLVIENNRIVKSGDKGISIGEKSAVKVKNNILEKGNFGLAVKDSSSAELINNDIIGNKVGVGAYNKKEIFGGGAFKVYNSVFKSNNQDFGLEVINQQDFRASNKGYQSNGEVYNSRYGFSWRQAQEIIRAPEDNAVSKRKMFTAYLTGRLEDYGFKFATLLDRALAGSDNNNPYYNQPVGADRELIKMSD